MWIPSKVNFRICFSRHCCELLYFLLVVGSVGEVVPLQKKDVCFPLSVQLSDLGLEIHVTVFGSAVLCMHLFSVSSVHV